MRSKSQAANANLITSYSEISDANGGELLVLHGSTQKHEGDNTTHTRFCSPTTWLNCPKASAN